MKALPGGIGTGDIYAVLIDHAAKLDGLLAVTSCQIDSSGLSK